MPSNNLPLQLTSFIGRERQIAEARKILQSTHLLTLTGAGGNGKTRLALAVAESLLEEYPDGIWLVELASLSDPSLIPQAIASALGVRESPGRPVMQTLEAYLKAKQALLLLDNCEHLIESCARLAHAVLVACPNLRILATSREPLHIAGEVTWLVPPLSLPNLQQLPPLEELARVEAVRLFIERARSSLPAFAMDRQNALPIAQVCCRLGGLPLAIELAAVRIGVLSPAQIAGRLDDAFRLLVTGERTAPTRHQTLQATLDWSYNLLPEMEQILLRRLSVFAGGWSLEAAETICGDEGGPEIKGEGGFRPAFPALPRQEVLDLLAQLVDKSLVVVDREPESGQRYRFLEPVRQYSLKKLHDSGEEALLRDRHLDWYLALAEQASPEVSGSGPKLWVGRLEQEYPNLRAALEWSLAEAYRAPLGYRLTSALGQFWQLRGHFSEGLEWIELALSRRAGVPDHLRAQGFHNLGFLAFHTGEVELAKRSFELALELWQGLGDRDRIATQKGFLGLVAVSAGDFEQALRLGEESLAMHRENGNAWGAAVALLLLGDLAYFRGDFLRARANVEESLAVCRQNSYMLATARRLTRSGHIALALGEPGGAKTFFEESLRLSREAGDHWGIAMAIAGMAGLARAERQPERAARLLGATQAVLDLFGAHLWPIDRQEFDRNLSAVKTQLGEQAFERVWNEAVALDTGDLERAIHLALAEADQAGAESPGDMQEPEQASLTALRAAKREFGGLTRREREVAALIAKGKSNPEIAQSLFVGLRTVEAHVTNILSKLGFNSRTQIAGWAVEKGLASSPKALEDQVDGIQ